MLYVMGTKMRNTLMAAIYRKCLRLSNTSLQAESPGKVGYFWTGKALVCVWRL